MRKWDARLGKQISFEGRRILPTEERGDRGRGGFARGRNVRRRKIRVLRKRSRARAANVKFDEQFRRPRHDFLRFSNVTYIPTVT